jgi:hypothetical protein
MDIQNPTEEIKVRGVVELLKESWQIYHSKIKTLLGLTAILIGFNIFSKLLIGALDNSDLRYSVIFSVITAIFSLVSLFLSLWIVPSLVFAIKEDIGITGSLSKGLKNLLSYAWIYFLLTALFIGSYLL